MGTASRAPGNAGDDHSRGDGQYGPEVKALPGRYLAQMIDELTALPDTTGKAETAWDTVELVVPHQANKTMVIDLAARSGLAADRLYFQHRVDG